MAFLKILGVIVIGAVAALGGFFANHTASQNAPLAGSFTPVQGQTYTLSGAGINSSATSITLNSFKTPDGRALTMSMFGATGYAVIDPNSPTKIEDITFTGITQNANGTAVLTGVSRGMDFVTPYTASTTLAQSHSGGSYLILSNSAGFYGQQFGLLGNDQVFSGVNQFTVPPILNDTNATSTSQAASRQFVLNTAIQGAGTSTEVSMGISQLPTNSQIGTGVASSSSGAPLVIENRFATTTPGTLCTGGTIKCIVASTLGKISQSFLDLTQLFSFSGGVSSTGTTTISASSLVTNPLVLNTLPYIFSSTRGASSTVLTEDGTGKLKFLTPSVQVLSGTYANVTSTTGATTTLITYAMPANTVAKTSQMLEITSMWDSSGGGSNCGPQIDFGNGSATTTVGTMVLNNSAGTIGTIHTTMFATSTSGEIFSQIANTTGNGLSSNSFNFTNQQGAGIGIVVGSTIASTDLTGISYIAFRTNSGGGLTCRLISYQISLTSN